MSARVEKWRCPVCGRETMERAHRPYEADVAHDGRSPVRIRIPDLPVVACTNPDCHATNPDEAVIYDDDTLHYITTETYRQLGLLTPEEIRAGRERLGLSQQEMAELLGLGGNSLSRWENGRVYQSRSTDTLLRLLFDVPQVLSYLRSRRRQVPCPSVSAGM